jgi:hypothetical protein
LEHEGRIEPLIIEVALAAAGGAAGDTDTIYPPESRLRTIASRPVPLYLIWDGFAPLARSFGPEAVSSGSAELPQTEFAFADHPLVPVYLVFDAIARCIALVEQQADDFEAPFGGMLDAPFGEKFDRLADLVFVFRHADPSGLMSLRVRRGNGRMVDNNGRPQHPVRHDANQ